jgi:hypothetical protein
MDIFVDEHSLDGGTVVLQGSPEMHGMSLAASLIAEFMARRKRSGGR